MEFQCQRLLLRACTFRYSSRPWGYLLNPTFQMSRRECRRPLHCSSRRLLKLGTGDEELERELEKYGVSLEETLPRQSDAVDVAEVMGARLKRLADDSQELRHAADLSLLRLTMAKAASYSYPTLTIYELPAPHVGSIKIIALNQPEKRNALSRQLVSELNEQIESIHHETGAGKTRALILASNANDAFCAGADLKERKEMTQEEVRKFLDFVRHTFTRLETLAIPTIACVSGAALGGGLELALCTQFRVFSAGALVGLPETRLGIIPGAGGTFRLPQAIGLARARELILTGRRVNAVEAANMGLCHSLVAADDLAIGLDISSKRELALWEGLTLAYNISSGGPVAIRAAISALKGGGSPEAERMAYETILDTNDRVEALAAFSEKRLPKFTGK